MILRLQSSIEIKQKLDGSCELSSPFLKKKFGVVAKNPRIFLLINDLKKGIVLPLQLKDLSKKYDCKKSLLKTVISKLRSMNLLIEEEVSSKSPQSTLYDRQIRFFKTFEKQGMSGETFQDNLQNRSVLVVGLGGYGSWMALLCARIGIKNIIAIDFDHVEITNLHRQVLYEKKDIGKLKIEACKRKILDCDGTINFTGHCLKIKHPHDLQHIVEQVDLVLNPFSYLPIDKAKTHPAGIVAIAALQMQKPCLSFGGSWIGPLTLPGKTPCYFCAVSKLASHANLDPDYRSPFIQKRAFAPPIAACCSLAAFEASRFLSACDEAQTLKGIMQLDILSFANNQFFTLERDQKCCFCSPNTFENKEDA